MRAMNFSETNNQNVVLPQVQQKVQTPCYYYNLGLLRETLKSASESSSKYGYTIHYAIKANSNHHILSEVAKAGLGADCVSGNEIVTAIANGFTPNQIVYAGVGKTDEDILIGLRNGIFCFNCESLQEIEVIAEIAEREGLQAQIALRLNPDVDAKTHKYITTGLTENKFGINLWEVDDALAILASNEYLNLVGLHFHIGSQITDFEPYKELCEKVNAVQDILSDKGVEVPHINLGGGLGIDYENPVDNPIPDFNQFFAVINEALVLREGQRVHFEFGRSLVGQCGTLLAKVLYIKNGHQKNFAIVDAGMTDMIRPALYQAQHLVENMTSALPTNKRYDVVGPICESSDCFGRELKLPETSRGDIIAIHSVGAYGEVMSMNYNMRNEASAVFGNESVSEFLTESSVSLQA